MLPFASNRTPRRPLKQPHPVNLAHLDRRAERAAPLIDSAAFVHEHTLAGLLERLEPVTMDAALVVDLGCGAGGATPALEKRFRGARIVGVDRSLPLLRLARARRRWLSRAACVRSEPGRLPLADHAVDVVFSNLALAAVDDPAPVAADVSRVLRRDGLFVFATLGPDSLGALRHAWEAVDDGPHVQRFLDMHDLGDLLVRAGLRDPVLDVDRLQLEYESPAALFRDLGAAGARNFLAGRQRSLTGRGRFRRMLAALDEQNAGGKIRIELEIVYGHCWGSGRVQRAGDVRIDAATIPLRRRQR